MLRNQLKGREAKLKRKRVTETCGSMLHRLVEECDTDLWKCVLHRPVEVCDTDLYKRVTQTCGRV